MVGRIEQLGSTLWLLLWFLLFPYLLTSVYDFGMTRALLLGHAGVVILFAVIRYHDVYHWVGRRPIGWRGFFSVVLFSVLIWYITNSFTQAFSGVAPFLFGPRSIELTWQYVVLVLLGAPVAEEIVFRRGMYKELSEHTPPTLALIISSLFFAILHNQPGYVFGLFVLGVYLSVVFERFGSLSLSIVAHSVFNLCSLLALYFDFGYYIWNLGVAMILLFISLVALIAIHTKEVVYGEEEEEADHQSRTAS